MNVVVITTGLNVGGAETMLLHMVAEWIKSGHRVNVYSLSNVCYLDENFAELGVDLKRYDLKNSANFFGECIGYAKI